MAIKLYLNRFRNPVKHSLVFFVLAVFVSACDQSNKASNNDLSNKVEEEAVIKNNTLNDDNGLFTLEDLEQRLLPLQTKIKQLENELEENQTTSAVKLDQLDDKKWNSTKLEEIISTLKDNNQDMQSQLKNSQEEVESLQSALKKIDLECNDNIKSRI